MEIHDNKIIMLNFPPALDYSYSNKGGIYPSTGILLIGTLLKKNGYDVTIIDCAYEEEYLEILKDHVSTSNVLYVGMSVMTTQIPFALEASKIIKRFNKDTPVIWGGPHPTLYPEQTLAGENVDIVVINEGAFTSLHLANSFKNGASIEDIRGLGYKDENDKICINPQAELEDLNELPYFDFSLIDIKNYIESNSTSVYQREFPSFKEKLKVMPILTGLGCAYKCEFCINVILKRKYRARSAESIVDEIKHLQQNYGVNTFLFLDEDFFINKRRVLEFIDIVEKEELHFNWRMWCRVDHFRDNYINSDLLKRLSNIGYGSMVMGGESANQEILDDLKKGITPDQIINSLELITETTIFPRYSFMVGLENETMSQIKNTYNLCLKMFRMNSKVDISGPFIFRLYAGSPIYNRLVIKYNLNVPDDLNSWVEHLKIEDSYTEMPWTPKQFKGITKLLTFYSSYAFTDYAEVVRNPGLILHLFIGPLARIRLKYLFLKCPFEYWMRMRAGTVLKLIAK